MRWLRSTRGKVIMGAGGVGGILVLVGLSVVISFNAAWPLTRDIVLVGVALLGAIPFLALGYTILLVGPLRGSSDENCTQSSAMLPGRRTTSMRRC